MYDKPEQWVSGGNCDICRRAKYCSKPCKENKRRVTRILYSAAARCMLDAILKEDTK